MKLFKYYGLLLILALAACQSTPPQPGMQVGKPYSVEGKMYYPEYEPEYDKTGEASWYGPGFDGKYTASGEIFDQNDLTAAHPTLPMPSLVRVTNLNNGKSLIVRVNDRGPFKSNRIIDLSKASAKELGIRSIARVRVQFLQQETTEYLASLQGGGERVIDMAQYNNAAEATRNKAPEEEQSQIVEATDSSSHAGQIVDDAAPVVTVNATELATPAAGRKPAQAGGLIKSAWADDNVAIAQAKPIAAPVEEEEQTANDPPPAPMPAAHATFAAANYIVQAGAFSSEENAHKLASKLSGLAALSIDKTDVAGKSWWRVRLGPFKSKEAADNVLAKLDAVGVSDAKIIHL